MTRISFLVICVGVVAAAISVILTRRRAALTVLGVMVLALGSIVVVTYQEKSRPPEPSPQYGFAPTDEMLEKASIYPTLRAAADKLGARLQRLLAPAQMNAALVRAQSGHFEQPRMTPSTQPALDVQGNAPPEAKRVLRNWLAGAAASDPNLRITADVQQEKNRSILTVSLTGSVTVSEEAAYCDLPWADDSQPMISPPGGDPKFFVVGWSGDACTTQQEAIQKAQEAAVLQLAGPVYERNAGLRTYYESRPDLLRDRLLSHVHSTQLKTEQFVQSLNRSYGTIWRCAVRVDAPPAAIQMLAWDLQQEHRASVSHQRSGIISVALMAAVIVGVYWLMELLTRGYFSRPLRAMAVGALIVGAIVLMLVV